MTEIRREDIPGYLMKMATGDLRGVPLPVVEALGVQGSAVRADRLSAPVGVEPDPKRSCGHCTACCSTLGIEKSPGEEDLGLLSFEKVAGVRCQYEKNKRGCRKYKLRPLSCRIYACWWRRGWSIEDARPDKLKLIVDNGVNLEFLMSVSPTPLASVAETEPGVLGPRGCDLSEQHPLIQTLQKDRLVFVRYWGDAHPHQMYGPPEYLARVVEAERRMGLRP